MVDRIRDTGRIVDVTTDKGRAIALVEFESLAIKPISIPKGLLEQAGISPVEPGTCFQATIDREATEEGLVAPFGFTPVKPQVEDAPESLGK